MAIIKAFGIEIRTGEDRVGHGHQQAQQAPQQGFVPGSPSESRGLVVMDVPKKNSIRGMVSQIRPSTRIDSRLNGIKVAMRTRPTRASLARDIIFPPMPSDDDTAFNKDLYAKHVHDIVEMVTGNRYFSICPVDELMDICCIQGSPSIKKARDFLRNYHCTNWSSMSHETTELIFQSLSYIFTEGATPNPSPSQLEGLIKDL